MIVPIAVMVLSMPLFFMSPVKGTSVRLWIHLGTVGRLVCSGSTVD